MSREDWTFLTNHGHALLFLALNSHARIRDVAEGVGITERAAQKIVNELVSGGYLQKERRGRRNVYRVDTTQNLRHPLEEHCTIAELVGLVLSQAGDGEPPTR